MCGQCGAGTLAEYILHSFRLSVKENLSVLTKDKCLNLDSKLVLIEICAKIIGRGRHLVSPACATAQQSAKSIRQNNGYLLFLIS